MGEETNGETENLICNKFKSAKLRRKHGNAGNSYTIEIKEVVIYSERAINDEWNTNVFVEHSEVFALVHVSFHAVRFQYKFQC